MTDKEFAIQKARVKELIDKWADVFELDQWNMTFMWTRVLNEDNSDCIAKTHGRWQYRHATIEFFLPIVAENDNDDELERTVIHELMHIILLPMAQCLVEDAEHQHEYTTVSLQRVAVRAYLMGQKEKPKK